jgi:hypothetical protein
MGMALAVSVYGVSYCIVLYVLLEQQINRLVAATRADQERAEQRVMHGADVHSVP